MDLLGLKHDPKHFDKILIEKGESLLTSEDVSIFFPSRYLKVGLGSIERVVTVLAVFYIVHEDKCILIKNPYKVKTMPSGIKDHKIEDTDWKELMYQKGGTILENMSAVPSQDDSYTILDDWFIKSGNLPLLGYEDIMDVILEGPEISGVSFGKAIVDVALFLSVIARDKDNKFLREKHTREQIVAMKKIKYVGLSNFDQGYQDAVSYIASGAHLDKGVTAVLKMGDESPETDLDKRLR